MIDEKLVGELMGALATMQSTVATQTVQIQALAKEVMQMRAVVSRLACVGDPDHDTNPECLQSARPLLHSVHDDEPVSVVTRQMELKASKSGIELKGPSVMVLALGATVAIGAAIWAWIKNLPHSISGVP